MCNVCSAIDMRLAIPVLVAVPALAASIDVAFDVKQHLGNLSPQFTPSFGLAGGLGTGMSSECSLEQIQLVSLSPLPHFNLQFFNRNIFLNCAWR